jgi:hypothetical protein
LHEVGPDPPTRARGEASTRGRAAPSSRGRSRPSGVARGPGRAGAPWPAAWGGRCRRPLGPVPAAGRGLSLGEACAAGRWLSLGPVPAAGRRLSLGEACAAGRWLSLGPVPAAGRWLSLGPVPAAGRRLSSGEACAAGRWLSSGEVCAAGRWLSLGPVPAAGRGLSSGEACAAGRGLSSGKACAAGRGCRPRRRGPAPGWLPRPWLRAPRLPTWADPFALRRVRICRRGRAHTPTIAELSGSRSERALLGSRVAGVEVGFGREGRVVAPVVAPAANRVFLCGHALLEVLDGERLSSISRPHDRVRSD